MVKDRRPEGPQAEPSEETLANVMAMMSGRVLMRPEDRERVAKAFTLAAQLQSEARGSDDDVTVRDLAGYAVSRLATDIRAHLTIREVEAARLSALGLALLVRPDAMLAAGFAPVCSTPVREVLRYADAQYLAWHREVSQPLRDMVAVPGFRAGALRVFERVDRNEPRVLASEYRRIAKMVEARGPRARVRSRTASSVSCRHCGRSASRSAGSIRGQGRSASSVPRTGGRIRRPRRPLRPRRVPMRPRARTRADGTPTTRTPPPSTVGAHAMACWTTRTTWTTIRGASPILSVKSVRPSSSSRPG